MRLVAEKGDAIGVAQAEFRIYHGLTNERTVEIDSDDLHALWLRWRIDHDLPLKKEEWELHHDCWEIFSEGISVWYEGKYIGSIDLHVPASPELEKLMSKKKAA